MFHLNTVEGFIVALMFVGVIVVCECWIRLAYIHGFYPINRGKAISLVMSPLHATTVKEALWLN